MSIARIGNREQGTEDRKQEIQRVLKRAVCFGQMHLSVTIYH